MTREEVIDLLDNLLGVVEDNQGNDYDHALHIAIEALKAQQWIPCSERLPSEEQNFKGFLTTVECYVENDVFIQVYENGKFGHWDGEKLIPNDDVIAWMPLPEPYEENENG